MSRSRVAKRRATRAVIYIRVSKAREEMISPETQEFACQTLCTNNGLNVVEVVTDLDMTGREFGKRKIDYIIKGIEEGRWDTVVVWKWSRFGRNLSQSLANIERIEKAGGRLRAATEDFDADTTVGRHSRGTFLLNAELTSGMIGDGWKEAHARRLRMGKPHTGERRFGYTVSKQDGFQPHPIEGPALAEAYQRIIDGASFKSIATWLNSREIKTVPGNNWSPSSLAHLLQNGFAAGYIGVGFIKRGEYESMVKGAHQPLITEETWRAYLSKTERRPAYTRNNKKAYSVSGLVICGLCGGKMRARNTNGGGKKHASTMVGHTFECGRKVDRSACPGCNGSRKSIEAAALESLRQLVNNSEDSAEENLLRATKSAKVSTLIDDLERELAELKAERSLLFDLLKKDDIDREEYSERRASLNDSIADVTAKIGTAAVTSQRITPRMTPGARETLRIAMERWDDFSEEGKREILETHIQGIVVYPGKSYTPEQRSEKYRAVLLWEELPEFPHEPPKLPTRAPRTAPALAS